jgi:subtilisin family serine protease
VRRFALPLALLAAAIAAAPAQAGEIVIYGDTSASNASETAQRVDALDLDVEQRYTKAVNGFAADLTPEQEERLERDPEVAAVIEDRPVSEVAAVPAQPGSTIPPGITRVLQAAPNIVRQAATSSVAVLDTGVDLQHPDLDVVAGKNCVDLLAPPDDVRGHGTHVAGTIGAKDNAEDVVGVAPGTKIVAVKVLNDSGQGSTSTVLCGIEWVLQNRVAHDIEVVNLSLGGQGARSTCGSDYEHAAYCALADAGITTVVAAGNDHLDFGGSTAYSPAVYPEVLTVSAMGDTDGIPGGFGPDPFCSGYDADDLYASFSNFATSDADAQHLVAAPGVCVRSLWPGGGTATSNGTSMATPHVAGLVALCHGEAGAEGPCSGLTPAQVIRHFVDTASATTGAGFLPDQLNPTHRYGPLAVLPGSAPAPEPEPLEEGAVEEEPAVEQAPPPAPGPATQPGAPATPEPVTLEPRRTPAPRLTITPARLRQFLKRGLRARITCATTCTARVRLTGVRAGAARATRAGTVVLKPTRATRRALRRARRAVVTVRAEVRTPTGTVRLKRTIALS